MKSVVVEGIGEVRLRKSARAKRLILKITPEGKATVTVPNYIPYRVAEAFAKKHHDWFQANLPAESAPLVSGKLIGKTHHLKFVYGETEVPRSRVGRETITITIPPELEPTSPQVQAVAKQACIRALKKQAEATLPPLLWRLASRHGYTYREVRIKAAQTRWGSCSSKKVINLSVWLMQIPEELVEYVLCHELTHLHHMHHQSAFWEELARMIPDYRHRRKQLKQYQPALR